MLNSYYTDDINNNKIPKELIESYDEVIKNLLMKDLESMRSILLITKYQTN